MRCLMSMIMVCMVFQTPVMAQFEQPETGKQATEINWFPETEFKTADLSVFASYGYQSYNRYDQNYMIGVAAEFGFDTHWSTNYRIQAGPGYYHFPLSLPVAALCYVFGGPSSDMNLGRSLAKFLFLIPEGVSYSFDPIPGFTFKPYVNPLGVTFLKENNSQNIAFWEGYLMLSMGGSVQITAIRTWGISAYGEYRFAWNGERNGMQTGLRLNHNFNLNGRWPFLN